MICMLAIFATVFAISILLTSTISFVYAVTESESVIELGMPDITINPESGPVGSVITINVSNLPMPPDGADPRLEFYMYLPASEGYGFQLTNCTGHCIMLYSFDDIKNENIFPKEITFALPSVKNPDATSLGMSQSFAEIGIKQGTITSSVCDVVINDKIEYRFGYSCSNNDVPVGEYVVSFGWAINNSDVNDEKQTITFTVTDEPYQFKGISRNAVGITSDEWFGSSSSIFQKYEQGEITEAEFIVALKNNGWETDEEIRRALALVRLLEHQMEDPVFGVNISEVITMQGEVTGMLSDNTIVKIHRSTQMEDNIMKLTVMFEKSKFVNYDIVATQNGNIVLNDIGAYTMDGRSVHSTEALSSSDPFDVTITFQGYGVGDEKTGPIGEQVVFSNVIPEFGTITMMILAVAIISIIAVTAKSRVIPKL